MLHSQQSGWNKHSYLFTVYHCLESGTQGNLCLAKSHITTYQTIHGMTSFHIMLHIGSSLNLVRGILVREGSFQFMLQIIVRSKTMPLHLATTGIETNEVTCNVLHLLLSSVLHALPGACTQPADTRRFGIPTPVKAHLTHLMDGHIDHITTRIDNFHHLLLYTAILYTHQALIASHPVVNMYHIRTRLI